MGSSLGTAESIGSDRVLQKYFQDMELTSAVWKKLEGCRGDCQGFPQKRIGFHMTEAPGSRRMSGECHAMWGHAAGGGCAGRVEGRRVEGLCGAARRCAGQPP